MTTALEDLITQVNVVMAAMTGIERWFDDPPESISQFPSGMAFATSGELSAVSAGLSKSLHVLTLQVHHARTVSQDAINAAKVWPDRVLAVLAANPSVNGAADAVVWPIRYQALPLQYANELHYGVQFTVTFKVHGTW